jgi:hypothetical protein
LGAFVVSVIEKRQVTTKVYPAIVEYLRRVVAGLIAPRVSEIVFTSTGA